jgi:hypothetical protein
MNYSEQLKNPASLRYIDKIVDKVFEHPEDFEELFSLIFISDVEIAWRAAWACQKISIKRKNWFDHDKAVKLCQRVITLNHGGVRRGCLSVLINIDISACISVEMINFCFDNMLSPKAPVAVQALSMKFLLKVCEFEPDFASELLFSLENADYSLYTAGFNSTRKNTIRALNQYLKNSAGN